MDWCNYLEDAQYSQFALKLALELQLGNELKNLSLEDSEIHLCPSFSMPWCVFVNLLKCIWCVRMQVVYWEMCVDADQITLDSVFMTIFGCSWLRCAFSQTLQILQILDCLFMDLFALGCGRFLSNVLAQSALRVDRLAQCHSVASCSWSDGGECCRRNIRTIRQENSSNTRKCNE